jgi:hypothetical protein
MDKSVITKLTHDLVVLLNQYLEIFNQLGWIAIIKIITKLTHDLVVLLNQYLEIFNQLGWIAIIKII